MKTILVAISVCMCAALLAACGGESPSGSSASSAKTAPAPVPSGAQSGAFAPELSSSAASGAVDLAAPSHKIIGTKSEDVSVKLVSLLNLTGQDITGVAVKHSLEDAFGANLLASGETFALDEVRDLYYDIAPAMEAKKAKASTDELFYDVQFTMADGSTYVMHRFPFNDFEQGRILLQDGVVFLEYVSPYTGEEVVTRKDEIKAKKKAEKQAAEEAQKAAEQAAQQAAQQQAAQQQAAQQWAAQQPVVQQPAAQQPAQDAGCIGAGGLVY